MWLEISCPLKVNEGKQCETWARSYPLGTFRLSELSEIYWGLILTFPRSKGSFFVVLVQSNIAQSRMTGGFPGLNFLSNAATRLPTENFSFGQAGSADFVAARPTVLFASQKIFRSRSWKREQVFERRSIDLWANFVSLLPSLGVSAFTMVCCVLSALLVSLFQNQPSTLSKEGERSQGA